MPGGDAIYTVLFDIDGTLLMTGGAGKLCFLETLREDFHLAGPNGNVPFAGRSDRAIALELMRENGVEPSEENWQRFLTGYCRRIKTVLEASTGCVLPGVVELLDEIAELDHVAVGLLTGNVEQGARAKLAHYGLAERFAFGGFGDQHTDRNDIAAAALRAAEQYLAGNSNGTPPTLRGAMVIGDTVNDVVCARSIGAYAVAVATGHASAAELTASEPDLVLTDLTDADALLAELRAAPRGA
ncbi:MAG: haloacid dehalogenase-like hydrolase [Planctomycetes bacterium]|nr:haloacid dehalogenase-like hydrolase [Planctomycetota bacterium]